MFTLAIAFGIGLLLSLIVIKASIPWTHHFEILDTPGGHKSHAHDTPYTGGIGVFAALISTALILGTAVIHVELRISALLIGATTLFLVGLIDDAYHLSIQSRFLIQGIVALIMIFSGDIVIHEVGNLISAHPLELGLLAIPFTLFSTIGVINSLNMIDGIDGLAGSIALISTSLLAIVASLGGSSDYAILCIGLTGGLLGFLHFNLRYSSQRRARVFLGDNGSMLLGFFLAWVLIALSQSPRFDIPPVIALWLFSIPLMDTLSVMLRRIYFGRSPFRPDRYHIHHLFVRAGFGITTTVIIISLIHLLLGTLGIIAMLTNIGESWALIHFILLFILYFHLVMRPKRFIKNLKRMRTRLHIRADISSHATQPGKH